MNLLIDDLRTLEQAGAPEGTIICRTAAEGMSMLDNCHIKTLYLDNDLGGKVEGIDILKWARDHERVPHEVILVTANPIAFQRMEDVLRYDLKFVQRTRGWWVNDNG
jgi:response regulator of citrate/malate metabolism